MCGQYKAINYWLQFYVIVLEIYTKQILVGCRHWLRNNVITIDNKN